MEVPQAIKDSVAASKAEYRQLGKSGLKVSLPIFGCMSIGDPAWAEWVMDEEKVSGHDLFLQGKATRLICWII